MKYEKIELNDTGKAVICPVCGNEETLEEGEFCHVCGEILVNMCEREIYDDGERIGYCIGHKPLPGNARYCPYCGEKTTFFKTGALKPWEEELRPDFEGISDEDDTLPF